MTNKSIEKDWWITFVLKAIFALPMASHFIFKGGTSLSKGWKMTQRFSEDIDIALAPEAFGEIYLKTPSATQVKRLKRKGCAYTSMEIKTALEQQLLLMGVPKGMMTTEAETVDPTLPDKDPQTLLVTYPSLFDANNYLSEKVKIEFGVRALKEPYEEVVIQSILGEQSMVNAYQEQSFKVMAVMPHKTFMEKLCLLHEKMLTGRAEGDAGERQSRHLYDLAQMMNKGIDQTVIDDTSLYNTLLVHRSHYVKLKRVNYKDMALGKLAFLPPYQLLDNFRKDYETMREQMIYGDAPDFNQLMDQLRELNKKLAGVGHLKDVNEVISQAYQQIQEDKTDGAFQQTIVHYNTNIEAKAGPANPTMSFEVEFIKAGDKMIFHRLKIRAYPKE